ncbi:MAG TPA: hypothetical protein VKT31_08155 [Solirubrobacteraceae bacterium]|nr:hypothetical protein [Solirubrobacteraceae bacterium]
MRKKTIAIAGSIAALSLAATPVAAIAATSHAKPHTKPSAGQVDRSRDTRGVRHVDRTPDHSRADTSRDVRDR